MTRTAETRMTEKKAKDPTMRSQIRTAISRHLHEARPAHLQLMFENRPLRLQPDAASWLHIQLDWQQPDAGFALLDQPGPSGRLLACLAVAAGGGTTRLDEDSDWLAAILSWRCFGPVCLGGLTAAQTPVPARLSGPGLYTACFAAPVLPVTGQAEDRQAEDMKEI